MAACHLRQKRIPTSDFDLEQLPAILLALRTNARVKSVVVYFFGCLLFIHKCLACYIWV